MSETSQPRPDPRTTPSPDVPYSTDPQDIKGGLAQSPELSKIEILQNKALLLSEAIQKHDAETAKLTPDMVEELEQHAKVREQLQGQMTGLCKEISDHAKMTGRSGPGQGPGQGSGAKTLHFPVLDKAWELLMVALKALVELFSKGARVLRNLLPNAPDSKGVDPALAKPAPKQKTVIGLNLPGGPVAVNPPVPNAAKPATTEEVEKAAEEALDAGASRRSEIQNALASDKENANDSEGPAPGAATRKPK